MKTSPRIRIDVGANGVTVLLPGRTHAQITVEYTLPPTPESYTDTLSRVLAETCRRLEQATGSRFPGARVDVVLPPPVIDARLVQLPPLRRAEAEAVLHRDAARHFIGGTGPLAIALQMPARNRRSDPARPVFAVAAPAAFIDALHHAVEHVQWRVNSVTPAHAAWIAAARSRIPADDDMLLVCVVEGTAHVLRIRGSDVTALRRIPADAFSELAEVFSSGSTPIAAIGDEARAMCSHPALGQHPLQFVADDAIEYAGRSLAFVTPAMAASRARHRRAWASRLAAAAIAILLTSAAVHYWGLKREIAAVEKRRTEIRREVAPLLAWRDSLLLLEDRLAMLERIRPEPARLTRALFDIAALLPPDAHITTFRSKGDTIMISGLSPRAADAIQALRSALSFENVRLDGIIDRELDAGATAQERFNLEAVLTPSDSAARPRSRTARALAAERSGT